MANPLQEQLLKAGLISKQKVRDARTDNRRNRSQMQEMRNKLREDIKDKQKNQLQEDIERNKVIEKKRLEIGVQRSIITEIEKNFIKAPKGADIKFNYAMGTTVRFIYVDEQLKSDLSNGHLGIVYKDDKSYLVPYNLALKVQEIFPEFLGYIYDKLDQKSKDGEVEMDDPYADYKIPDDLVW